MNHDFDIAILDAADHRPWKMPERRWVMTQTWNDLLFAHWPVDPQALRPVVPSAFGLDVFGGLAWIGVVPFLMTNVAPRGLPRLPRISAFPELNVRTYVRVDDRPGVYFFSLDAGSAAAVYAARTALNLPYHSAAMAVTRRGETIDYRCRRRSNDQVGFEGTYAPEGPAFTPAAGSLEYFLTERYCLYHLDRRGAPYRLEIHHPVWHLQPARARITRNTMTAVAGLALPEREPLLHFSKRQDAVAWLPARL